MKSVLVTGGFGYLGSRLAVHLARSSGQRVVLGTRRPVPSPEWLGEASVVETHWQSDASLKEACKGVDAIVHLAGMNAEDCAADPAAALELNGLGTARLIDAAVAAGVKRFLYVSTAHVYGSPLQGLVTEGSCATARHPYATSHRAAEDVVRYAHEKSRMPGVVVRLSNSFGAPANARADCWTLLVNDLCSQAVRTRRMALRSSGLQRRDFVTLTDACRAISHLLELDGASLGDGLFNVGGGWAPTVREMTDRIQTCCEARLGYRPDIVRPEGRPGEGVADLQYGIGKLLGTGFALEGDTDAEICATLELCVRLRGVVSGNS